MPALTRLRGLAGALELIADFRGGVLRGRALRNAREAARVLAALREEGFREDFDDGSDDSEENSDGSDDESVQVAT